MHIANCDDESVEMDSNGAAREVDGRPTSLNSGATQEPGDLTAVANREAQANPRDTTYILAQ